MLSTEIDQCMARLAGYFPTLAGATPEEVSLWRREFGKVEEQDALEAIDAARMESRFNSVKLVEVFSRIRESQRKRQAPGERRTDSFPDIIRGHWKLPRGVDDDYAIILRWYAALWRRHGAKAGADRRLVNDCTAALVSAGMVGENNDMTFARRAAEAIRLPADEFAIAIQDVTDHAPRLSRQEAA